MTILAEFAVTVFLFYQNFLAPACKISSSFVFLFFACPPIQFAHWAFLNTAGVPTRIKLRLILLNGPALLLCLSLIIGLNSQLATCSMIKGATKEMMEISVQKKVPPIVFQFWLDELILAMRQQRNYYIVLFLSILTNYLLELHPFYKIGCIKLQWLRKTSSS